MSTALHFAFHLAVYAVVGCCGMLAGRWLRRWLHDRKGEPVSTEYQAELIDGPIVDAEEFPALGVVVVNSVQMDIEDFDAIFSRVTDDAGEVLMGGASDASA